MSIRLRPVVLVVSALCGLVAGVIAGAIATAAPSGGGGGDPVVPEATVVGGQLAPAGKWPDAVALISGGQGFCTGTLIAPDLVLTAGHCVGQGVQRVKIDATDSSGPGEDINVARVHAYAGWQNTYDVAVLVLASPSVTAPRTVATSCITDRFLGRGAAVQLVGYGATDIQGQTYNTRLREATASVLDPDCSGGNGCQPAVAPGGEMVAGGPTVNSCYGDSGGPVYLSTPEGIYLAGVVSRGVDNLTAPCQGGGIYVRPDAVLDWVEQTTGKALPRPACESAPPPDDGGGGQSDGDGGDDGDGDDDTGSGGDDDGPRGVGDGPVLGGCRAAGSSGGALGALALLALAALRRRRR
jgi:uncharacterized protein (TIGR03382 family)